MLTRLLKNINNNPNPEPYNDLYLLIAKKKFDAAIDFMKYSKLNHFAYYDNNQYTPLLLLCSYSTDEKIEKVIEAFAQYCPKEVMFGILTKDGKSFLHLLATGFFKFGLTLLKQNDFETRMDLHTFVNARDSNGDTALMLHIKQNMYKNIDPSTTHALIFSYFANIEFTDDFGRTILHEVCRNQRNKNRMRLVEYLIIQTNANTKTVDKEGKTPLSYLIQSGESLQSLCLLFQKMFKYTNDYQIEDLYLILLENGMPPPTNPQSECETDYFNWFRSVKIKIHLGRNPHGENHHFDNLQFD